MDNPAFLNSDYPFSIKKDENTALIFSHNTISFFDVRKTEIPQDPLTTTTLAGSCISQEEKGGIFLSDFYYTSCLKSSGDSKFQIKVFDSNFDLIKTYPSDDEYFEFTSSIRFYIKTTEPNYAEASWINDGIFNLAIFNNIQIESHKKYPLTNLARDNDCIYITQFNRAVCLMGIKYDEDFTCSLNIFSEDNNFVSNVKTWHDCNNHQSRKIRLDQDNPNIFYYYFVDTNYDAYIFILTMTSSLNVDNGPVLKIMSGCDEAQNSFDFAEDKFNEYFVFSCVEKRFKTKIKIQLFKIIDNEIIFYEDKSIDNTFEFKDDIVTSDISMINFVVLKSTLNFGFLSYRSRSSEGRYTIFNQPECSAYTLGMNLDKLYQNKNLNLDFTSTIKNDNYAGGSITIVQQYDGMDISVLSSGTDVNFISKDFIIGVLNFTFIVENTFYKSDICVAYVKIYECNKYCYTCSSKPSTFDFYSQLCEQECKPGFYPMINFPKNHNDNCCEKDVDCPDYFYLNNNNKYEICNIACLACTSNSEYDCISCYNEKELEAYSNEEVGYINDIKKDISSLWYYWEDDEHKKCVNKENEPYYYLDEETVTYRKCYKSCETCNGYGDENNNNCTRCRESLSYYHFETTSSLNCYNKDQAPENYYLFTDDYVATEVSQSRYWKKCDSVCSSCDDGGQSDCTKCSENTHPKCSDKSLSKFECYESKPEDKYYLDTINQCYALCDTSCKTCDGPPDLNSANCLSCIETKILLNKICYNHCPIDLFELDHKKCVDQCPEYTFPIKTNIDEYQYYYQCYNCKDVNKCIYLGTQDIPAHLLRTCIDCDSIPKTFISNTDYNTLDDCYSSCGTCTQRGTVLNMNCITCQDNINFCLVEETNNCILKNTAIDYYYMSSNVDGKCEYKKCYISCKVCNGQGDSVNNNCVSCADGYQPEPNNNGNCVEICEYYWYIDPDTNKYTCTESAKCPQSLPYLALVNNECVSDCIYAYSFSTVALYKYQKTCLTQCPDNTMRDNLYYNCYSLDDSRDIFNNVQNYISYQSVNPNNLLIYSNDKTKFFHLFNTTNQGLKYYQNSAKGAGTSLVDFSNCLATLRTEYGFTKNEIFYIGVMDIIRDDASAPQFEYTIHSHDGQKLDIDLCLDDEIVVNKSLEHSTHMDLVKFIKNYYDYDIVTYSNKNKFFCDICNKFEYDKNDPFDVILNDRYNEFYSNINYYFCESRCDSTKTKIYLDDMRVECVCKGKNNYESLVRDEYSKFDKIEQQCHDWFLQYFKCAKNFFNKNFFYKNYTNILMFLFVILQILSFILFFLVSKKNLLNYFNIILDKKAKKRKKYLKENNIYDEYNETVSRFKNTLTNNYTQSNTHSNNESNNYSKSREDSGRSSEMISENSENKSHSKNSGTSNNNSKKSNSNYSATNNQNEENENSASNSQNTKTKSDNSKESSYKDSSYNSQKESNKTGKISNNESQSKNKSGNKSQNENKSKTQSQSQSNVRRKQENNAENENGDGEDEVGNEDDENSENISSKISESENKSGKSNPPKKLKAKIKYKDSLIDDNSENNNDNISIKDIDEAEIKTDIKKVKVKPKEDKKNEEEQKNDKIENKKAPKTAYQKYAKRFLKNRIDYVDNEYREDSFDFKLEKNWREKNSFDEDENIEDEENEEHQEKDDDNNNEEKEKDEDKNSESHKEGYTGNIVKIDSQKNSQKSKHSSQHTQDSHKSKSNNINSNKSNNISNSNNGRSNNNNTTNNKINHKSNSKSNNSNSNNINNINNKSDSKANNKSSNNSKSKSNESNNISNNKGNSKNSNKSNIKSNNKNSNISSHKSNSNKSGNKKSENEESNVETVSGSNNNQSRQNNSSKNSQSQTYSSNNKSKSYRSKRSSKSHIKSMTYSQSQSRSIYSSENQEEEAEEREDQLYPQLITEKRTFSDALKKFENKSLSFLYWYILKKRHRIISLFIKRDKYDLFTLKFSFLILSLTLDFFFITFFYLDYVVRYMYKKKKHIEILCTLCLGVGTPILSHAVMRGMDFFMDKLKKKLKDYETDDKNIEKNYVYTFNIVIKEYTKAIIIYFILLFFFSLFVWYMVGTFIGTFSHTQTMWLIIFAINFFVSNFFSLIYYLIAVKLQYEGIHQKDIKLFRRGMTMQKI